MDNQELGALRKLAEAARELMSQAEQSLDFRPEFRRAIAGVHSALHAEPASQHDASGAAPAVQPSSELPSKIRDDLHVRRLALIREHGSAQLVADVLDGKVSIAAAVLTVAESLAARPGVQALTDEQITQGMVALLQCTLTELGDYSPKLLDGYRADVIRVGEAILASSSGAPNLPEGEKA